MSQKGFTMVEILLGVAIIGMLSVMTIIGYSKYQDWAKVEAYNVMSNSVHQAAEDYIMDHPGDAGEASEDATTHHYLPPAGNTILFETLVEEGYLKEPIDPDLKDQPCLGGVRIGYIDDENASTDERANALLDYYVYEIDLCCTNYKKQFVYSYIYNSVYQKWEPYNPVILTAPCDSYH